MKAAVIKEMTTEEIKEQLAEQKGTVVKLKVNHAVSPLENPLQLKQTRKIVARLQTELRKRELSNA